MTITLELPPETEAILAAQAKARGLSLDAFLRTIITNQATAMEPAKSVEGPLTGRETARAFRAWASSFPDELPVLSFEGMSR
jgi:hypothetical protein